MDKRKILVTGIGGNVGQGIIRNIRKSFQDICIIGTNVTTFSAGNHLCDIFYEVPFAYDNNYINTIQSICAKEQVELIIPSTDYEVYYLASNAKAFSATIAASGETASKIYLDKYLTYLHHQTNKIPFAVSYLPSEYKGYFKQSIAKPRKGRGSRGIIINPSKWSELQDDEYMIQELHIGKEITTAFYVTKQREILGFITLLRFLDNGATSQCKVVFEYDEVIRPILESIIKHTDVRGAVNLQSIVTKEGSIQPFEVNCRISGTNSIRSNFGFEDVKYTIEEYLYNQAPNKPIIKSGVAVRVLMDVIYPNKEEFEFCRDNKVNFHIF